MLSLLPISLTMLVTEEPDHDSESISVVRSPIGSGSELPHNRSSNAVTTWRQLHITIEWHGHCLELTRSTRQTPRVPFYFKPDNKLYCVYISFLTNLVVKRSPPLGEANKQAKVELRKIQVVDCRNARTGNVWCSHQKTK